MLTILTLPHPQVLARLPGAPEGTRGISLFAVPRRKLEADGSNGDLNGAKIGRIEDKMGCHGSPTCEINFDEAQGHLIGTENRGLNHMFTFINTSRMGTAIQGLAAAENAFQNALWYAKDRCSMRSLTGTKNPAGPADPIICHPDVRKMLLTQKCISEGGRAMLFDCGLLADVMADAASSGNDELHKQMDDDMGFVTPILKGFLTELGVEAANIGIQVYGGHGYIKSNKQEQVLRDVRIAPVWEGTTGIQGLDLLGRKIMLQKFKPINRQCAMMRADCIKLIMEGGGGNTRAHAMTLLKHVIEWQYLTYRIGMKAKSDKDAIGAASVDYLMYSGYIMMAGQWLKMEAAACKALKDGDAAQDKEFYEAKIKTSQFYFDGILPRTRSLTETMMCPVSSVMDMKEEHFAFDH